MSIKWRSVVYTLVPFSLWSMHKSSHLLVNFCCKCSSAQIWWKILCKLIKTNRNCRILSIFRYWTHFVVNVNWKICCCCVLTLFFYHYQASGEKIINCFGSHSWIKLCRWRLCHCCVSSFPIPLYLNLSITAVFF